MQDVVQDRVKWRALWIQQRDFEFQTSREFCWPAEWLPAFEEMSCTQKTWMRHTLTWNLSEAMLCYVNWRFLQVT